MPKFNTPSFGKTAGMTASSCSEAAESSAKPVEPRRIAITSRRLGQVSLRLSRALLLIAIILGGSAVSARATDDTDNSTPTAWWIYTGQSVADIDNTLHGDNARIVDIAADDASFRTFTVTYVKNTGSYAKTWWWYYGVDAATLAQKLTANNARLISVKAYDGGGGNLRFVAAMVANTGADTKEWWWYYGQSPDQITSLVKSHNARLTTLQSYSFGGQTSYAAIMISNTGADAKGWWWYYNLSPQAVANNISTNKARLLDITPAGNGNFNVTMESCSSGCPYWWWYYGLTSDQVLAQTQNNGARAFVLEPYSNCGSGACFATVMIGNTPADVTACDDKGCISEAKLQSNICSKLVDHVVGYACLVGSLRPISDGLARTTANPPSRTMESSLLTDIASVSKTMTAISILQLLAADGLTIDTKISPYVYSDWSQGPNINTLTFRNLLTHTSGFGQLPGNACGNDITYAALKTIVADGVTTNIGVPSYGNCNFALLRELMPALLKQPLNNVPDGAQRAQKSSAMYIGYVQSHVFEPVGVKDSSCKPPTDTSGILSYPYPAGTASGTDWGDWSLQCGSGGWVLSANDIFNVVNALANGGGTLLTAAEKKQMFADSLGWDSAVRNDCPDPYVCKNGDLNNGSGGIAVWTYAGVLKCNVPVVVVVNSPLPSPYQGGEDIIGLVKDAYNNATVPGTGTKCP
jgi:hypothetical protein